MYPEAKLLLGYYQNVRGLRTKSHNFLSQIAATDYDFICVTESWLTPDFYDREYFDSRYVVFRCDRSHEESGATRGGGVMVAVRTKLMPLRRNWPTPPRAASDCVWLSIPLNIDNKYLNIACIYIPHGPGYRDALEGFFNCASDIFNDRPNDIFLIVGDFNVSEAVWQGTPTFSKLLQKGGDFAVKALRDFLAFTNLQQFNGAYNVNNRILDLVMSNITCKVMSCSQPLTQEDAHHKSIEICLNIDNFKTLNSFPTYSYNFHAADFDCLNNELKNINWLKLFETLNLDECVSKFYEILRNVIAKFVPRKIIRSSESCPVWHTKPLRKVLNEKKKYHKLWKLYGNPLDYQCFNILRRRGKRMETECYNKYIQYTENKIQTNSKYFWTYVKAIKATSGLPRTMFYNGKSSSDGKQICDFFNEHFHSVFVNNTSQSLPNRRTIPLNCVLDIGSVEINPELVNKYLKNLDVIKGAGPDGIHPLFIRRCADTLSFPLTYIFRLSFDNGCVPQVWKCAWITPIPKGKACEEVTNYRPISKLCQFAKIQEKIVTDQLFEVVQRVIVPNQHGFCKKRGVESNLITFTELILSAMDENTQVDAIYTDFAKAFDKICHDTLLFKLWQLGIHGDLFRWIRSYIGNRSQAVVLCGYRSAYKNIPSGVPQGSHLGPLLFIIYVNDLTKSINHSNVLLYADDTKIYKVIKDMNDSALLQSDLNDFVEFCNSSNLFLNLNKCFVISFTRSKNPIVYPYKICGHDLDRVSEIRDLGVVMDSKLSFIPHVDKIVANSYKFLGFILRVGKPFKNASTYKLLFNSYVRSRLEFASPVWNPHQRVHQDKIEKLQRKFVKSLDYRTGNQHIDYESSLVFHKISTLRQRRDITDITYLFKILHNMVDAPVLLEQIYFRVPRKQERTSRKKYLFAIKSSKTGYGSNSFIKRACASYNRQLGSIELFNISLIKFKNHITDLICANVD